MLHCCFKCGPKGRYSLSFRRLSLQKFELKGIEKETFPDWLKLELRTNQAGEYGAVQIYNGAYYGLKFHENVNVWIDKYPVKDAINFALRHKATESQHLDLLNQIVDADQRTSLIPVILYIVLFS
jgi:demethoxyubiquinone hydroxylase (CLK1/Coq7/Cat5 family)